MACSEKAKAAAKAWYWANKEKVLAFQKAHYQANKERILERNAAWRKANQVAVTNAPSRKKKYERDPEKRAAWVEANRDRIRSQNRARGKENPKYIAMNRDAQNRRRRARCKWADRAKVLAIYEEAARLSKETGVPYVVDHIVPLKHSLVCGLHNEFNLRVITALENGRKKNRFEIT